MRRLRSTDAPLWEAQAPDSADERGQTVIVRIVRCLPAVVKAQQHSTGLVSAGDRAGQTSGVVTPSGGDHEQGSKALWASSKGPAPKFDQRRCPRRTGVGDFGRQAEISSQKSASSRACARSSVDGLRGAGCARGFQRPADPARRDYKDRERASSAYRHRGDVGVSASAGRRGRAPENGRPA